MFYYPILWVSFSAHSGYFLFSPCFISCFVFVNKLQSFDLSCSLFGHSILSTLILLTYVVPLPFVAWHNIFSKEQFFCSILTSSSVSCDDFLFVSFRSFLVSTFLFYFITHQLWCRSSLVFLNRVRCVVIGWALPRPFPQPFLPFYLRLWSVDPFLRLFSCPCRLCSLGCCVCVCVYVSVRV